MSDIPETIPDVGSVQQQVRRNPNFDPTTIGSFTSEDYFVLSRIDGQLTVREVLLETGFSVHRAIEIMRKLKQAGAFLLPGERPYNPGARKPKPTRPPNPRPQRVSTSPTAVGTIPPSNRMIAVPKRPEELVLSDVEKAALEEEGVVLSREERLEILKLLRVVERGNLFEVLDVEITVDKRTLRQAYRRISKQVHPDRYYSKQTGSFGPWLSRIFETATRAFDVLSNDDRRAEYAAILEGRPRAPGLVRAQTHQEHAAELFERGCKLEVGGNTLEALKLFAAVNRIDPQPRYMRRAARCALGADQLSLAEEYAKKAAGLQLDDPSSARVLASVYRVAGKLSDAKAVLERAISLNPNNDTLLKELETDLQAVKDDLAKQP